MFKSFSWLVTLVGFMVLMGCGGKSATQPLALQLLPPTNAMPAPGSRVHFEVRVTGGKAPAFQWLRNDQELPGATGPVLDLFPVAFGDAGAYRVRVTDAEGSQLSQAFVVEPVDAFWVVTSVADQGPGSLREALAKTLGVPGRIGIQFVLPGSGAVTLTLESSLPPIQQNVCILGPQERALTVSGAGRVRPFLLQGGTLILDNFTLADGLGKGGDGRGGGGGAAGMGGAVFTNSGNLDLRRMVFRDNRAVGGSSGLGGDGEGGGGGGFAGDSPASGGDGAGGGFLGGTGGSGQLDGTHPDEAGASGEGAGGGAVRGGPLSEPVATWAAQARAGDATWGAGGGFSVGPLGGGGNAGSFGGGGGGSGGALGSVVLPGNSGGEAGVFGGAGGRGDGILPGRGGGGGAMGGAIFLRGGTLVMEQCSFISNHALPGNGAQAGLGKGGAIFIYAFDPDRPFDLAMLGRQTYRDNTAPDLAEDPKTDNADWYVASDILARHAAPALALRYLMYRQQRLLGWPVSPPGQPGPGAR